jgi:hypothetical protein
VFRTTFGAKFRAKFRAKIRAKFRKQEIVMSGRFTRIAILFGFSLCGLIAQTRADDGSPVDLQSPVEELVQQLGSDSYDARELASRQILKRGLPAKTALLAGLRHPDPEIAFRCRRLWDEVRMQAGWEQVRDVIGDSPESKALFRTMFLADSAMWSDLAEKPRPFETVSAERMYAGQKDRLQQGLKKGDLPFWAIEGALANLFYFGVQAKRDNPQQELPSVEDLLNTGRCQYALKNSESLRDVWDLFAKATATDGPALDRLMSALRTGNPQSSVIARSMLGDQQVSAKQRQYAILALAKSKSVEDEKLIRQVLGDTSALDTLFKKGVLIKSQLRDVALATLIYRAGQDPREYGFVDLKPDPVTLYSPSSLGFKNDEDRARALKTWNDFAARRALESDK